MFVLHEGDAGLSQSEVMQLQELSLSKILTEN